MFFRSDFPAHFLLKHFSFKSILRQNLGYNDLTRNSFELGRNLHKHDVVGASIASAAAMFSKHELFSLLLPKGQHLMTF